MCYNVIYLYFKVHFVNVTKLKSDIPYASNCYLLEDSGEVMLIDPSSDPDKILSENNIPIKNIKYIFLTHAHFDHILYLNEWVERTKILPTTSIHEGKALSDPINNCYELFFGEKKGYFGEYNTVNCGDILKLGNTELKVISTPGHTEGSLCLLSDGILFSGDTVFAAGSIGRCDLPSGEYAKLNESLKSICSLDDNIEVYPGHNRKTTIKEIKLYHR